MIDWVASVYMVVNIYYTGESKISRNLYPYLVRGDKLMNKTTLVPSREGYYIRRENYSVGKHRCASVGKAKTWQPGGFPGVSTFFCLLTLHSRLLTL